MSGLEYGFQRAHVRALESILMEALFFLKFFKLLRSFYGIKKDPEKRLRVAKKVN